MCELELKQTQNEQHNAKYKQKQKPTGYVVNFVAYSFQVVIVTWQKRYKRINKQTIIITTKYAWMNNGSKLSILPDDGSGQMGNVFVSVHMTTI